jgi:YD repeat-containing protein
MVSIFTGLGSGFERGSLAQLGSAGLLGSGALGRSGEQLSLNAATGNFLISQRDEFLAGAGPDSAISRTYNSLGNFSDENGDNWRQSTDRRVHGLTGTLNASGSTISRVSADGSDIVYTWNSTASAYVATGGSGAYDKLTSSSGVWTWTDGDSQSTETYEAYGTDNWRITHAANSSGSALTFTYSGALLDKVATANGEYEQYSWSGSNITQIVTGYTDLATSTAKTLTRTRYGYDGSNRLTSVTVDLTPGDNSVSDGATYVTTYTYDGTSKRVASISETDGSQVAVAYDGSGRVTSLTQTVASGVTRVTSIAYFTGYTTITDPLSQVTRLDYDSSDQLTYITAPITVTGGTAQVTHFTYDSSGNVLSASDALGKITSYTYDGSGNVLTVTDPLSNVITRTYGSRNELLTETTTGLPTGGAPAYTFTSTSNTSLAAGSIGVSVAAGDVITFDILIKGSGSNTTAAFVIAATVGGGGYTASVVSGPGSVSSPAGGAWVDVTGLSTTAETHIRLTHTVAAAEYDYVYFLSGVSGDPARSGKAVVIGSPSLTKYTPGTSTTSSNYITDLTNGAQWSGINTIASAGTIGVSADQTSRYTYDSSDRLEYAISAEGRVTRYQYTSFGAVQWVETYTGGVYDVSTLTSIVTLTSSQIATWVSSLSDKTTITNSFHDYDTRGNLSIEKFYNVAGSTGAADSAGGYKQVNYVYDQAGQLLSRVVNGLNTETFVYDGLGRVIASTDLNGATTSIAFNDALMQTVVTLAGTATRTSTYNKSGELIAATDSLDTTSGNLLPDLSNTAQWGGNATVTGGATIGGAAANTYTAVDNGVTLAATGIPVAAGDTLTFEISLKASGSTTASLLGLIGTTSAWGSAPNVSFSILSGPGTISSVYGAGGEISGLSTSSETRIRITQTFAAAQYVYTYIWAGSASVSPRAGSAMVFGLPSLVKTQAAVPQYQYDQDGQLRIHTDRTGRSSYFLYDHAGRKTADIGAYGNITEYKYDADDRIIATVRYATTVGSALTGLQSMATTDIASIRPTGVANDLWTWRIYDVSGRLIKTIDGAGDVTAFQYDSSDRLIATTVYANKVSVSGFVTTPPTATTSGITPTADTAHDSVTRVFYDKQGLVVGALDGEGYLTKITYDSAGRKVKETAFATISSSSYWANGTFSQLLTSAGASSADRTSRWVYDGQGDLRYTIDSLNHVVEYGYKVAGSATSSIGDVRTVTQYATAIGTPSAWTETGVAAAIATNAADRTSYAVYDTADRLAYAIDASGAVTSYGYDALGRVIRTKAFATLRSTSSLPDLATMAAWAANSANLSADDRVTASVRFDTAINATTFAAFTDSTTLATIAGLATGAAVTDAVTYDNDGRVLTRTNAAGATEARVTSYVYNANGTLASTFEAYGTADQVETRFTYDNAGRMQTRTDAAGATEAQVTTWAYDGLGDVVSVMDANGNFSYSYYDHLGQAIATRDAEDYVTQLSYNAFGEVSSSTRRANKATNTAGVANFPVYTADAAKDATTYTYYDTLGRVIRTRDAENYITETNYTVFGEVGSVTRRYARTTDAVSTTILPTATPDTAHDATTSFEYDRLGRLTKTIAAEVDQSSQPIYEAYTLNAFGNRIQVRNRLGAVTTNVYDRRGLLTSETLPITSIRANGTTEASSVTNTFEYDARGNRKKMTEALNLTEQRITTYDYDRLDQLTATHLPAVLDSTGSTTVNPIEYIAYDARGNVIQQTDAASGRTLFYYDKLGRQTVSIGATGTYSTTSYTLGGGTNGGTVTSRIYDAQVTLPTTPGGTPPTATGSFRESVNSYDKLGRLSSTSTASVRTGTWNSTTNVYSTSVVTVTSSWQYDANGNVIKTTDGNRGLIYSYYDKVGRKIAQVDQLGYLTKWTLDADGNALSETRFFNATSGATTAAQPSVTADATKDRTTNFTYDRTGNRLTETRINVGGYAIDNLTTGTLIALAPGTPASDAAIVYTYNALGQVLTKREATGDTTAYTYDSAGRLMVESRQSYQDYISTAGTPVTDTPAVRYFYDGLGDLTRTTQGGATAGSGDRVTSYEYGPGGRLTAMVDATSTTSSQARHLYYYDIVGRKVGEAYNRLKSDNTTVVQEGTSFQYNAAGQLVRQAFATVSSGVFTDAGAITTIAYNAYGEAVSRSLAGVPGATAVVQEQYRYDNAGRLEASSAGDGVWRYYIYDANGNRTAEIDDEGKSGVNLVNQSLATVLGIATASGANTIGAAYIDGVNATISAYDARNQAVTAIQTKRQLSGTATTTAATVDLTSSRAYNAFGETLTDSDALGHVTTYGYNAMGRTISVQHAQVSYENTNLTTTNVTPTDTYFYDISGRLLGQQDANGKLTTRLLIAGTGYGQSTALIAKEYHADQGVITNGFDQFGDLRRVTDEIGRVTNNSYDTLGRLTNVTHASGLTDYYTYDVLGQRIAHANSFISGYRETTDYDVQGRVVSQVAFGGDTTTISYSWSSVQGTTGLGTFGAYTQVTTFINGKSISETSDGFGHVISHTDMTSRTNNTSYDTAGRLVSRSLDSTAYSYLNTGLVSQVTVGTTGNPASQAIFDDTRTTYTYDKLGEKLTETSLHESGSFYYSYYISLSTTLQNATAAYDALGRMTSWSESGTALSGTTAATVPAASKSWTYDKVGNVRHVHASYHNLDLNGATVSTVSTLDDWYNYDAMNRVTTSKGVVDASSGLIVRGYQGVDLAYDAAGERMIATSTLSGTATVWDPNGYDPNAYGGWGGNTGNYIGVAYDYDHRENFTYDAAGAITTLRVAEGSYTDNGDLTVTSTAPPATGALKAAYQYDAMGRLVLEMDYLGDGSVYAGSGYDYFYNVPATSIAAYHYNAYDASSHVTSSIDIQRQGSDTIQVDTTNTYGSGTSYALGAVVSSTAKNFKNGTLQFTASTVTSYDWYDGAVQKQVDYTPSTSAPGTVFHTIYTNSLTGVFQSAQVNDGRPRSITVASDVLGQVIKRDEQDGNTNTTTGGDPHELWYRFNGKQVGYVGNNGTQNGDYTDSMAIRSQARGTGAFRSGSSYSSQYADFDQNYVATNAYGQGSTGSTYVVHGGDTLSSIAAQLWGDASLWYKLAQANGLSSDTGLTAGQTLLVPAGVNDIHNNSSTFKPYSSSDAYGDTSPTTPQPQAAAKKGCGILGAIIIAVIAIAVTVVTAGAAVAALAPASSGITGIFGAAGGISAMFGAGGVAGALGGGLAGALGAVTIGAGSAAIGSIVSQGIGVATGLQDQFSWKAVGLAALGGGVTAGIGSSGAFKFIDSDVLRAGISGAAGSAITQGLGIATGLQHNFDWVGVAAAGVGAAAGQIGPLGKLAPLSGSGNTIGNYAAHFAQSGVSAIANAATRSLISGSDFGDNILAALPDVIAQTVGDLIFNGLSKGQSPEKLRRQLDGDQAQRDAALTTLDAPRVKRISDLDRQIARAERDGDAGRVSELTAERDTLANPIISRRTLLATAAYIKYGNGSIQATAEQVVGANSSVVPLGDDTPSGVAAPQEEGGDVVVTGRRIGEKISRGSTVGRVVVDALDYTHEKVESYGTLGSFAFAGVKFLATGGLQPLLSFGINQGVSHAIPFLPDDVLNPIATIAGKAKDFLGGGGGSILLDTDRDAVGERDRDGVSWGAESLIGISATAIAGTALRYILKAKALTKGDFPDVATEISEQRQFRHVAGTKQLAARNGGGYLDSVADAQKVLDAFHSGSAKILGRSSQGFPIVRVKGVVGTNVNKGAGIASQATSVFMIKGTVSPSIVPVNPNLKP